MKLFIDTAKFSIFCVLCFMFCPHGFCQEKIEPVDVTGDEVIYLQAEGKVIAQGNVKLRYKDILLFCDKVDYDDNKNIAHLKGNIKIVRKDATTYAKRAIYDFTTGSAKILGLRIESPPVYGKAEEGEKEGKEKYILRKGHITTCDLDEPHYRLVAKKIIVYPKQRVVAKNMVLKIGSVPIFCFPYYSHSLKDKSFPLEIMPGKHKEWGKYVLMRWRYNLEESNKGKVNTDWYEKRGLGLGVTHKTQTNKWGEGLFNYYFLDDEFYHPDKRDYLFETYPERNATSPKYLENDRYKAQISYSLKPTSNLSFKSEFYNFSDQNFRKDFFYREYEVEPTPLSYALFDYSLSHSSLSLLTQKRTNRFFTQTEYLPQLEHNFYHQKLGETSLYLESKTSLGNLNYKTANSDIDYDAFRGYSHNVLNLPQNIKWLYLNPYVGSYAAFYTKNTFGEENIFRVAPQAGIDLSTKLHKYFNVNFNIWGRKVEKMRHLLTPTLSYEYVHEPTTADNHIFQFDRIDSLVREEKVIFKLDNKLQAKNDKEVWDFVYFSPSTEYRINQEAKGSYFDNIKANLEINPIKGLSLVADSFYSVSTEKFTGFNADLNIYDTGERKKYSLDLGHRYSREDSTQGTLCLKHKLNPKWEFNHYLRYEYNTQDMQKQQHSLRLDLHCWWMDFGVDIDKQRKRVKDFTFWVAFTLKAFPDIYTGFDQNYHARRDKGR